MVDLLHVIVTLLQNLKALGEFLMVLQIIGPVLCLVLVWSGIGVVMFLRRCLKDRSGPPGIRDTLYGILLWPKDLF